MNTWLIFGQVVLSGETSVNVTIAVCIAIVTALVLGTWRVSTLLNRLDRRFDSLERKTGESWSIDDMRAWARLLDKQNDAVKVPDVDGVVENKVYRATGTQPPV